MKSRICKIGLLLCVLLAALVIAGLLLRNPPKISWGFSTLHNRYTFTVNSGKLWVHCSPPAKWTPQESQAWEDLKRLRNNDIAWKIYGKPNETVVAALSLKSHSAAWDLYRLSAQSDRPLLRGLDGPNKFLAASAVLWMRKQNPPYPQVVISDPDIRHEQDPLVDIARPRVGGWMIADGKVVRHDADVPHGLSEIRDYWHERLDRTIVFVSLWWILVVVCMPIVIALGHHLRTLVRAKAGLCRHCGYDLRASNGACPECGNSIADRRSTA